MANEFRIPVLDRTGKYLGIPSDWGRSKRDMFAWILARVNRKLEGWKENLISKGGKEILIKGVVQAIPHYAMSIFKIPHSLCQSIEKKIASFWWKNNSQRQGIHWKDWNILKNRKELGGLGFTDLIAFNRAMLGKQAWRLLQQPSSLWTQLFKGLYFHSQDFLCAAKGARPSWGWRSILLGRESILSKLQWSVGDGTHIKIHEDQWLSRGKLVGPAARDEPKMVAELIEPEHNRWDVSLLHRFFDVETTTEIQAIPIRPHHTADQLIWTDDPHGQYSVKRGYHTIRRTASTTNENRASSSYQPPNLLWKSIWKLHLPPKIRIFLWSICQNALPTRDNLFQRHISPDPVCALCATHMPETLEHLFLLCPWTLKVWSHPQIGIHIIPTEIRRIDAWIEDRLTQHRNSPGLDIVGALLWQIWKARNRFIFSHKWPDPTFVVEKGLLQVCLAQHTTSALTGSLQKAAGPDSLWTAPDPDVLCCRCFFRSSG